MRTRRGFTLIELLIVITIIILLAAVLLPTLGMMKELLVRLECKTNLKKVHNYLMAYASRWDGKLPGFGMSSIYESEQGFPGGTPKGRHLMMETLRDLGAKSTYFCCPAYPGYRELEDTAFGRWDDGAYRLAGSYGGWSKYYSTPGYVFFQYVEDHGRHPTGGTVMPNRWATWSRFMNGRFLPTRSDSQGNPPLAADVTMVDTAYHGFYHDIHREGLSGSESDERCIQPGGGGHTLFLAGDVIWYDWGELEAQGAGYEQQDNRYQYFGMEPLTN